MSCSFSKPKTEISVYNQARGYNYKQLQLSTVQFGQADAGVTPSSTSTSESPSTILHIHRGSFILV